MIDPYRRDRMVAYVETEPNRIKVVRQLEKNAEAMTTEAFNNMLLSMKKEGVVELLHGLQSEGIISKQSKKPESWDLTIEGRELLYALKHPVVKVPWNPMGTIRGISDRLRKLLKL